MYDFSSQSFKMFRRESTDFSVSWVLERNIIIIEFLGIQVCRPPLAQWCLIYWGVKAWNMILITSSLTLFHRWGEISRRVQRMCGQSIAISNDSRQHHRPSSHAASVTLSILVSKAKRPSPTPKRVITHPSSTTKLRTATRFSRHFSSCWRECSEPRR